MDLIGQTLSQRYKILNLIGQGVLADVYRAQDVQSGRYLALKFLRPEFVGDPTLRLAFRQEAAVLASLQHPNIVRCHGLAEEGTRLFFIMDLVQGSTLQVEIPKITQARFSPQIILSIFRPICNALSYAHQRRVIHCDIKPSNILYDVSGKWLLSDFSIAHITGLSQSVIAGVGTPEYMAPEQVRGGSLGQWTDLYSLGIVLFQLLCGGALPFNGDKAPIRAGLKERIFWEHVNLPAPSPMDFNPQLSLETANVVCTCLQKSPASRFDHVGELLQALEAAVASQPAPEGSQVDWIVPGSDVTIEPVMSDSPATDPFGKRVDHKAPSIKKPVTTGRGRKWLLVVLSLVALVGLAFGILSFNRDIVLALSPTQAPTLTHTATVTLSPTRTVSPTITSTPVRAAAVIMRAEGLVQYQFPGRGPALLEAGKLIPASFDTRIWTGTGSVEILLEHDNILFLGEDSTIHLISPESTQDAPETQLLFERGRALALAITQPITITARSQSYWSKAELGSASGLTYDPVQDIFWVDCLAGTCKVGIGAWTGSSGFGGRGIGKGAQALVQKGGDRWADWFRLAGTDIPLLMTTTPKPPIATPGP